MVDYQLPLRVTDAGIELRISRWILTIEGGDFDSIRDEVPTTIRVRVEEVGHGTLKPMVLDDSKDDGFGYWANLSDGRTVSRICDTLERNMDWDATRCFIKSFIGSEGPRVRRVAT